MRIFIQYKFFRLRFEVCTCKTSEMFMSGLFSLPKVRGTQYNKHNMTYSINSTQHISAESSNGLTVNWMFSSSRRRTPFLCTRRVIRPGRVRHCDVRPQGSKRCAEVCLAVELGLWWSNARVHAPGEARRLRRRAQRSSAPVVFMITYGELVTRTSQIILHRRACVK